MASRTYVHGWKFGDLMRYPVDQDPDDPPAWVFMFVAHRAFDSSSNYLNIMVVRAHADDDMWESGTMLVAGINEMVPLDG